MLKLFRNLREKMIEQKKVKNYILYALGEIFLVVIGILIALQINNWNEGQTKKKEEVRILNNLHRDLSKDIQQLSKNIESTHVRIQQIDSIFIILNNPNQSSIGDFIRFNVGITEGDIFELNSGTYDESLTSGKINYIQVDTLREQIFEYYRTVNENLTQTNTYKFLIETIIPKWGDIVIPTQEAMSYLGLNNALPPMNIKDLAADKDYNIVLAQTVANHSTLIQLWRGHIKKATQLRDRIEASK